MGVFASVMVPCPFCGTRVEFQSKGANGRRNECWMGNLEDCPADVLSDINRHAPYTCTNSECNGSFSVRIFAYGIPVINNPILMEKDNEDSDT